MHTAFEAEVKRERETIMMVPAEGCKLVQGQARRGGRALLHHEGARAPEFTVETGSCEVPAGHLGQG